MLKKEMVTLSVGKWREDELTGVQADLSVTDGDPELKGVCPALSHVSPRSDASSTLQWISTGLSTRRLGKPPNHLIT